MAKKDFANVIKLRILSGKIIPDSLFGPDVFQEGGKRVSQTESNVTTEAEGQRNVTTLPQQLSV